MKRATVRAVSTLALASVGALALGQSYHVTLIPGFGGFFTYPTAISQSGVAVANASDAADDYHAFAYEAGVQRDLGSLGNC